MILPFLDAAPPASAAKPLLNGADGSAGASASGGFEALLAGLALPGAATPGAVLPQTGKTLPGASESDDDLLTTIDGGDAFSAPDGLRAPERPSVQDLSPAPNIQFAAYAVPTNDVLPGQAAQTVVGTDSVSQTRQIESASLVGPASNGQDAALAATTGTLPAAPAPAPTALPEAATATARPSATTASPAPAPGDGAVADLPVAEQPAGDGAAVPADDASDRALTSVSRIVVPKVLIEGADPQFPELTVNPAQPDRAAAKPAQPFAPVVTILPAAAQQSEAETTSSTTRRSTEAKFALTPLSAMSDAATLATAPAAVPVAPASAPLDAAPASPQFAVQSPAQASVQAIALPDHRALVDALVRAQAERDPGVSISVETAEFGAVALRFETLQSASGERGLQVAMSSGDPAFDRAVASAAAAQAALADQSTRNPAHRTDTPPARSGEPSADLMGGRGSQPDQQAQQRSSTGGDWRDGRSSPSNDRFARADARFQATQHAARPERRRGSIFA